MRQHACGCLNERSFVTLFLGFLDPTSGQLDYINAGQEGVGLLREDGTWEPLPTSTTPIGLPLLEACETARALVPPGGTLAAWSDGFPEAHRIEHNDVIWFESERMIATLREFAPPPTAGRRGHAL